MRAVAAESRRVRANRRIQIELEVAEQIALDLIQQTALALRDWIREAGGEEREAMASLGAYPKMIHVASARIEDEEIYAQIVQDDGPEGHFCVGGGIGRIEPNVWGLQLVYNSGYPILAYALPDPVARKQITETIIHELTHFADPGLRVGSRFVAGGPPRSSEEYINRPEEVKAFGQEVIYEMLTIFPELERRGIAPSAAAFRAAVVLAPTWQQTACHMQERNQQRILRDAYQEFTGRGLL